MTIIIVIMALTIGAISKSFGWVKQKNTEQTMTKVITRLQRVIDRIYKEADDWPSATESIIFDEANGSYERARVLKVLYLYKWNFPNTYAEAFHNVQESRSLYDAIGGYPAARAILAKLRSNYSVIPDPFNPLIPATTAWTAATPNTPAETALEIPWENSACLMAAFTYANGSPDEFTNNEVVVTNLPVGIFDPALGAFNTNDANPKLTDAWGTPLLFLRHGNFAYSQQRLGNNIPGAAQPAWTMGLARPAAIAPNQFAPIEWILNPAANQPPTAATGDLTSYSFSQLQTRANSAYPSLYGRDPFDPTGLLRNNTNQWRSSLAPAGVWMNRPWLAVATAFAHGNWFRASFGYSPEVSAQTIGSLVIDNQAFTPMVILSAGGDKLFTTWDDNLDSYRLQINVSGQQ
ncbi:MAG TPA: hypothetical protein PLN21_04475 [Gemmatales bacterium]|nr:hypothetical protein [Gemmatales bacterium]